MDDLIKVKNISLRYQSAQALSIKKICKKVLGKGEDSILNRYEALQDISLTIKKGKVYGVIGNNGAGKSTLLRVLSGVMSPNKGSIERNYKTINLLALGVGFSSELTGMENIYLNGMLLGFTKKQISAVKDEIIEYSELGDFINKPMKTYSSGMISRLGFSIAIHLKPEVLLIDEVLSVGDTKFQLKSSESIKNIIKNENITVVMVTHSMSVIKELCDYVIWLDKGEVIAQGNCVEIVNLYDSYNKGKISMSELKKLKERYIHEENNCIKISAKDYYIYLSESAEKKEEKGYQELGEYDYVQSLCIEDTSFKITKRVLKSGDIFLYIEGENSKEQQIQIELDTVKQELIFEKYYKKPPYDNRYGENKISGLSKYLDLEKGSACFTKIYYFRERTEKYESGESYLLELIAERNDIECKENIIKVKLQKCESQFCFTMILSRDKLFRNLDNLDEYMKYYYKSVYNNSVWCSFFLRPSGTYTKLPYSIEPFTRDGYGFSLQHSSRKDMIPYYEQTKENFFLDMIENAILQTFLYQKNENYVFFTPFTSTWLKKDTGITAPYIDTRLNETFCHFLEDFLPYSEWKGKIEPSKNYVDFLYERWIEGKQVYQVENGVFFPDYFKKGLKGMTHASLNHQLGTASIFSKEYEKTKNTKYLDVFKAILFFVEQTKEDWIEKQSGDLYYGVRMNQGKLEYYGKDYIYVTLLDLLLVQEQFLKWNDGKPNKVLYDLTVKKITYLETTKYAVFDEKSVPAPGEGVNSRKQVVKLIEKVYGKI